MTAREFLRELAKLKDRFHVEPNGALRCERGDCPIAAVATAITGQHYDTALWRQGADRLGLKRGTAAAIVNAADQRHALRRPYLLKALGLAEPVK